MTKDAFARPAVAARSSRLVRRAVDPQLPFIPFGLAPLVGLFAVFVLALGPVAFGWVQGPTERAARQALADVAATWATAKVSGQWVVLEGRPPTREAAAIALDAVLKARAATFLGPAAPATHVTERFSWAGEADGAVSPALSNAIPANPAAALPLAPVQAEPARAAAPSPSTCDAFMSALLANSTIEFDKSSAVVRPANAQLIDGIVRIAATCPGTLRIEGHTDNAGSPKMNAALSRQRARAVRDALIQRGISPDRISAEGFGAARPIADNGDEAGRARNRRIEIRVVPPPT
ncbi:MAG TPA: OmpA family protein [Hyphomonadaceae bacterium]|nr:OmpA family protein [Hyphomonadaceae bacterium]